MLSKNDSYQIVYEVYQDDSNKIYEYGNILYANLIYNLGHNNDVVKKILQIQRNNLNFFQNYDLFLDELSISKNNDKIEIVHFIGGG